MDFSSHPKYPDHLDSWDNGLPFGRTYPFAPTAPFYNPYGAAYYQTPMTPPNLHGCCSPFHGCGGTYGRPFPRNSFGPGPCRTDGPKRMDGCPKYSPEYNINCHDNQRPSKEEIGAESFNEFIAPLLNGFLQGAQKKNCDKDSQKESSQSKKKGCATTKENEQLEKQYPDFFKDIFIPLMHADKSYSETKTGQCKKDNEKKDQKTDEAMKARKCADVNSRAKPQKSREAPKEQQQQHPANDVKDQFIQIPTFWGPMYVKVDKKNVENGDTSVSSKQSPTSQKKVEKKNEEKEKEYVTKETPVNKENGALKVGKNRQEDPTEIPSKQSASSSEKTDLIKEKTDITAYIVNKSDDTHDEGADKGKENAAAVSGNSVSSSISHNEMTDSEQTGCVDKNDLSWSENDINDFIVVKEATDGVADIRDTKEEHVEQKEGGTLFDYVVSVPSSINGDEDERKQSAENAINNKDLVDITDYVVTGPSTNCNVDEDNAQKSNVESCPNAADDETDDKWTLNFDLRDFTAEEISVRISGRKLLVQAAHEEETEDGPISEEFWKSMPIPKDVDPDTIKSVLNDDGQLIVKASKIKDALNDRNVSVMKGNEI